MSDDHRMVPDFSEQLLDIADTIERLQKERDQLGAGGKVWQRTAGHLKQERDAALKQFSVDASQAQHQIDMAAAQRVQIKDLQGRLWSVRESRDHARTQLDAALAEVERLKGVIKAEIEYQRGF